MAPRPLIPLLDKLLCEIPRSYRLPPFAAGSPLYQAGAATALAVVIEQARRKMAAGGVPDAVLQSRFVRALAQMLRDAMDTERGDPVFQAMVLRHRSPIVREYAALATSGKSDSRQIRSAVNRFAHAARLQRMPPGALCDTLARLQIHVFHADWLQLAQAVQHALNMPQAAEDASLRHGLQGLQHNPALERLQRVQRLEADDLVQHYQSLWSQRGPSSGSASAAAQGQVSRQIGVEVEERARQALEILVDRLNTEASDAAFYCVVSSMRVPASIAADWDRAKTEWDVVLLRRAQGADRSALWDVCLLVEAKASVDASTTDLPRLLRGVRLLARADPTATYPFETRDGIVHLRGTSLHALTTQETDLRRMVLYCCNAPAGNAVRLLSAAARMQLLSAPASLAFACELAGGCEPDPAMLAGLWHDLLHSVQWQAVLHQYPSLHLVRELMVHTDDLLSAAGGGA